MRALKVLAVIPLWFLLTADASPAPSDNPSPQPTPTPIHAYITLDVSYLLALALAIPAAGFLLRTYIVFHDCAHGSFLPSKRANAWLGIALGLLVWAPFLSWRHSHAVHHATAGDLDRRGVGDVLTLTVAEYRASGWRRRLGYRLHTCRD